MNRIITAGSSPFFRTGRHASDDSMELLVMQALRKMIRSQNPPTPYWHTWKIMKHSPTYIKVQSNFQINRMYIILKINTEMNALDLSFHLNNTIPTAWRTFDHLRLTKPMHRWQVGRCLNKLFGDIVESVANIRPSEATA